MFSGEVPTINANRNWDFLQIDFFNLYGMSKLNVRVENEALGSASPNRNCYQSNITVDPKDDLLVTFYNNEPYGQGEFLIMQGSNLTAYASGNVRGRGACIGFVGTNS